MITLLDDYYRIDSRSDEGDKTVFGVTLLPDYCAYRGHFPGNPVSPGVCNIQMIKECAERLVGKRLFLGYIAKCRMSAVITPQISPRLQIRMKFSEVSTAAVETVYQVSATVSDDTTIYMEFKGELTSNRTK